MSKGANKMRRGSSGLVFKAAIAAVLFVAGLVLGSSGKATISAPDCEAPAATAPATAGVIVHG